MIKNELIHEVIMLCKANENNPYCSIFWLADQIKELVEGDLEEAE